MLVIGDRAMKVPEAPFHSVVDLAEAWKALTGLAVRLSPSGSSGLGVDLGDLPDVLDRLPKRGAGPRRRAGRHPRAEARARLRNLPRIPDVKILSYDLGEPEVAGLRRFARMAADLGLAPQGVDLVFHRRRDLATSR